jgi:hypothetical protein
MSESTNLRTSRSNLLQATNMWRVSFVFDLFAIPTYHIPRGIIFFLEKCFCVCGVAVHVTNSPCPSTHYDTRLSKCLVNFTRSLSPTKGERYCTGMRALGRCVSSSSRLC